MSLSLYTDVTWYLAVLVAESGGASSSSPSSLVSPLTGRGGRSLTSTVRLRGLMRSLLSSSTMTGSRGVGLKRPRRRGLWSGASSFLTMFFQIPELSTACVMLMSDFLLPGGAWGDLLVCVPLEAPSFSRVGKEMEEERNTFYCA